MKIQLQKSQKQGRSWVSCLKEPTFSQKSQLVKLTQKLRKSQLFETNLDLFHQFSYTLAVVHLYSFRYLRIWHALAVNTDQLLLLIFTNSIVCTQVETLLPQISTNLESIAVLAFWSFSVTHIHNENRFHSIVVQLYQFRSIRIRDI